ncbi:metal ABC transporter permease [Anaerococcus degeneri]|uniref:Metal ABC transporter permease n=1 Tax=Anaerococcus degeneri TaxID=361500 RepID=A0ABS7YY62_9FIRM|nr:metal ABC transporter permease [Anaerococcus degeneri]MBP2015182.1 manganese/zinc/iron transport system permease protein [Anaerococcus degeneri]MCA2095441.1 metal ABC transporter permease [Anaerococcus degeneri]
MLDFLRYSFISNYQTLLVLLVTAIACSLIGVFLVLRRLSMLADAISHSILLGIVLAYFIVKDITSVYLVFGAAIFGIITVLSIESLSKTKLVKNDDAVGIVFPMFFALAVILITKYARNVHLDVDVVLMGEVIMAPLNTMNFLGYEIPKSLLQMSVIGLVNLTFIVVFFKELKLTTFDSEFAKIAGFSEVLLFYALMTLTSFTTVVAFEAVGAILVISFLIAPAASAYLISKNLRTMIIISVFYAIINSILGFVLAMYYNLSMSGMSATIAGITFLLTFLFNKNGFLMKMLTRKKNHREFKKDAFLMHVGNHHGQVDASEELGLSTIYKHLSWKKEDIEKYSQILISENKIEVDGGIYKLTEKGRILYVSLIKDYGL